MRSAPLIVLTLALPALLACREGSTASSAQGIRLPLFGANGCNGPAQGLGSTVEIALATLDVGPTSQMAASADQLGGGTVYEVYVTGADATLVQLRFDTADPDTPISELELVSAGEIDALPEYAAVAAPAELAGVAVLDSGFVVLAEASGNTLLLARRSTPAAVTVYPGLLPSDPGNADGPGALIRFDFDGPVGLLPTGDGRILISDPGNHSVRQMGVGGLPSTDTLAGTGAPFFADGRLTTTGLDTPTGLAADCFGDVVVTDSGLGGGGGHRLRSLRIGSFNPFLGGYDGESTTLAGDGSATSAEGTGVAASLAVPIAPVTSEGGEVYWIDSLTGVLRRFDSETGLADCPLSAGCAASFTPGAHFSAVIAENGSLYVVDSDANAGAGALYRVAP